MLLVFCVWLWIILSAFILLKLLGMPSEEEALAPVLILVGMTFLLILPLQIRLNVKRLHDLGLSGYWAILMLAPIVNVLLAWALFLWPGQAYPNRYGNPPK